MSKTNKELLNEIKILKLEKEILELKLQAKALEVVRIEYVPIQYERPYINPMQPSNPNQPIWGTGTPPVQNPVTCTSETVFFSNK